MSKVTLGRYLVVPWRWSENCKGLTGSFQPAELTHKLLSASSNFMTENRISKIQYTAQMINPTVGSIIYDFTNFETMRETVKLQSAAKAYRTNGKNAWKAL